MQIDLLSIQSLYINLDSAVLRRNSIEDSLFQNGFRYIRRIEAIQRTNGYLGLCESQIRAIKIGNPPFLLLEDDAKIADFQRYIDIPDDADALYLGTSNWALSKNKTTHDLKFSRTKYPGIFQIHNMLSAHAILIISDSYKETAIKMLEANLGGETEISDKVLTRLQKEFHVYCREEPIFVQDNFEDSLSDATNWTTSSLTKYPRSKSWLGKSIPMNFKAFKVILVSFFSRN